MPEDEVLIQLNKYIEDMFLSHAHWLGAVKKVSKYGGSAFVIFENGQTYRLNFGLYKDDVIMDGSDLRAPK